VLSAECPSCRPVSSPVSLLIFSTDLYNDILYTKPPLNTPVMSRSIDSQWNQPIMSLRVTLDGCQQHRDSQTSCSERVLDTPSAVTRKRGHLLPMKVETGSENSVSWAVIQSWSVQRVSNGYETRSSDTYRRRLQAYKDDWHQTTGLTDNTQSLRLNHRQQTLAADAHGSPRLLNWRLHNTWGDSTASTYY